MCRTRRTRILGGVVMVLAATLLMSSPMVANAAPGSLTIEFNQVFTTASTTADGTFTYRLVPVGGANPLPEPADAQGYTFTVSGTATRQIGPITYTKPGLYRYELSQVVGTHKPGYTYDYQTYTLEVSVKESGEITLIAKDKGRGKTDSIRFENVYAHAVTDPGLMTDPPIKKTVFGNPPYQTTFEFTLVAKDANHPMPTGSVGTTKTMRIKGSGSAEFGTWSYSRPGTYYYTVSEVNTHASGYIYDTEVYTITDTVTETGGELVLSRTVTNSANKPVTTLAFLNKFAEGKEGPATGDDINIALYRNLLVYGGIVALIATLYLVFGERRKGSGREKA